MASSNPPSRPLSPTLPAHPSKVRLLVLFPHPKWAFKGESEARSERASARGQGKEEKEGEGGDVNGRGGGEGGGGGGGGGRGKGPAGAALVSSVAAPAVWRRTGAAGAPPAGARSHPGRASRRGASGRARCARGLGGPRVAAASELVRRGLASGAARARPASPAPARLLPLAVGASAAAGDTRRTEARAEPSPSRRRRRRRRRCCAPLPGSLPARRPGCGGRRAGGARAGQGAHTGVGAEDRTLSLEGWKSKLFLFLHLDRKQKFSLGQESLNFLIQHLFKSEDAD
ncbi:homeobox protein Hox-D9-like [Pan paniscus]|uniref:homeobox protein Hox-D9-like n=1 Tax=Pan paniscus TaxID=9597 RepID=UPI003006635F